MRGVFKGDCYKMLYETMRLLTGARAEDSLKPETRKLKSAGTAKQIARMMWHG